MPEPSRPARAYRSSLRSHQAAETRDRVVATSGRLFAQDGYARTTLSAIAEAADVSVETVQAHGPKRELLGAALRRATFGREGDEPMLHAPEAREVLDAATPHELSEAVADLMVQFNVRTAGIWRAFASAAADDPAVDQEWSAVMVAIRDNVAEVVTLVSSRGWTRVDVDIEELVASAWILVGWEIYEKLTVRLGWTPERYRSWLSRSIADLILA